MSEEDKNEESEPRVEGELGVTEGVNADGDIEVDVTEVEVTSEDGQVTEVDVVEEDTVVHVDAPDEPGVADPAEPECKGQFCVVFTVVEAPDLRNVNGGDPINPSFGPHAPPVTMG